MFEIGKGILIGASHRDTVCVVSQGCGPAAVYGDENLTMPLFFGMGRRDE